MNIKDLRREAEEELEAEKRRAKIDEIKASLRKKKPFWHRVFPWKITITRR